MASPRSPFAALLDLFVYAPLGLALEARDQLPALIERGRTELTGQVGTARTVGQFAVVQGSREVRRRLEGTGSLSNATPAPTDADATEPPAPPVSDAPTYPPGPTPAPSATSDVSPRPLGASIDATAMAPAAFGGGAVRRAAAVDAAPVSDDDLDDALAATLTAPGAAGTAVVDETVAGEGAPGATGGEAAAIGTVGDDAADLVRAVAAALPDASAEPEPAGSGGRAEPAGSGRGTHRSGGGANPTGAAGGGRGAGAAPAVLTDDVLDSPLGLELGGAPGAPTALAADDALPIPDYDSLSASQVVARLPGLAADELEMVRAYEAAGRARRTVLDRISTLQAGTDPG